MRPPADDLFCATCLRNQTIMRNVLAEYLPDEDDPEYEKHEAAYDEYKLELEQRYPQVCSTCEPRVQAQIASTGYAAKADHLRRIMEKSQKRRSTVQTFRQTWTLRLIALGKWTYVANILAGILWHGFALFMTIHNDYLADDAFKWDVCLAQALSVFSVSESCVLSPFIIRLQQYAILADLITLWWNPKLRFKTNSLTGRMSGLKSLWMIRIAVVLLRCANLHYWTKTTVTHESAQNFHIANAAMLLVLALSSVLTWRRVRIVYVTPTSVGHAIQEQMPSTPNSAEKRPRSSYRPAHPQANTFDNMAQAFTTSFQDGTAVPPSPTLTVASYTTYNTDATTPFAQRNAFLAEDDMDWTPTQQRRFASQEPEIIPDPWFNRSAQRQHSPPSPSKPEPHSLFSRPDPNPFRHKVPAAPKAPAQAKANPWKPGVWNPPNKETIPNFFREQQKARGNVGEPKGLDGVGVPKNVKRDAELFASPKFKYDNYGPMKDTGLEDTFNDLFSK